jgi:hypothetical protein
MLANYLFETHFPQTDMALRGKWHPIDNHLVLFSSKSNITAILKMLPNNHVSFVTFYPNTSIRQFSNYAHNYLTCMKNFSKKM